MPDLYATIEDASLDVTEPLVALLELRAADVKQRKMRAHYLGELQLPPGAVVLEIGCGTGAVSRELARTPGIDAVIGVDPCQAFVEAAENLTELGSKVSFRCGDARRLSFDDESFDVVVAHTVLSHVPEVQQALSEARRVLRSDGLLAIFDGDYVATTMATGAHDPIQTCVEAAIDELVFHQSLVRQLPLLVAQAGFNQRSFQTHSYLDCEDDGYLATFAHRGADFLHQQGRISSALAIALQEEIRTRLCERRAFGHILYASLIAQKEVSRPPQPRMSLDGEKHRDASRS